MINFFGMFYFEINMITEMEEGNTFIYWKAGEFFKFIIFLKNNWFCSHSIATCWWSGTPVVERYKLKIIFTNYLFYYSQIIQLEIKSKYIK